MGIFSKKEEVDLEEYCKDFYEREILNPTTEGVDFGAVFADTIKKKVEEVDSNFAKISSKKIAKEVIYIRFELFALAWLHQFGDNSAVVQSEFTRNYLNEKGRDVIWDGMESYNQAIARSTTLGKSSKNRFDRAYVTRVNTTRFGLGKQYIEDCEKLGIDFNNEAAQPILKSISRTLNRLFAEDAWRKGVTAGLLMFALCNRLGFESEFEPTKEAQFRLTTIIRGFYDGAKQALEKVKIKNK